MDLQELSKGSVHPNGIDGEEFEVKKRLKTDDELLLVLKKVEEDEIIKEE